jgi:hypothetical protein
MHIALNPIKLGSSDLAPVTRCSTLLAASAHVGDRFSL